MSPSLDTTPERQALFGGALDAATEENSDRSLRTHISRKTGRHVRSAFLSKALCSQRCATTLSHRCHSHKAWASARLGVGGLTQPYGLDQRRFVPTTQTTEETDQNRASSPVWDMTANPGIVATVSHEL